VLAKDIVKLWKEAVDEGKKKRKREEEESGGGSAVKEEGKRSEIKPKREEGVKRVKTEKESATTPTAPSTSTSTPKQEEDAKPDTDAGRPESPVQTPLSTIDSSRTTPRTAKLDGVASTLRAEASGGEATVRDKCVILVYDALASDSTAGKSAILLSTFDSSLPIGIAAYLLLSTHRDKSADNS
jgi:transcription elongation factor S-II